MKKEIRLAKALLESKGYQVRESEVDDARAEYRKQVMRHQHPNDPIGYPDFDEESWKRDKEEKEERRNAFLSRRRSEEGAPDDYEYSGVLDQFIKYTPDGKSFDVWNKSKEIEEHLEVSPNNDSTTAEKVAYVKKMVEKAKKDGDEHSAWDIVDFLYNSNLLDKIKESKKMRESRRSRGNRLNKSNKMREAHTVELYKSHDGEPERKRFSDYKSAKDFADSQTNNYEEIIITIPAAGGPSTLNSWSKKDGWYRTVESRKMRESIRKRLKESDSWDRDPMNGHKYEVSGASPNYTETGMDYSIHNGGYKDNPKSAIISYLRLSQEHPSDVSIQTNKNAYAQELLQWVVDNEEEFRSLCNKYKCPYKVDYMIDACKKKLERPSNFENKYNYPDQIHPFDLG